MQTKGKQATGQTDAADGKATSSTANGDQAAPHKQDQKDKPAKQQNRDRKSARGPRGPKKQQNEEGKDGPHEMKYQQKAANQDGADSAPATSNQEKKPKQQYRQKGEAKEATGEEQADVPVDQKNADATATDTQQTNQKKNKQRKNNQEPRYRPKGQSAEGGAEDAAPKQDDDDSGAAPKEGGKGAGGDKSKPEETKNLVYQNPMEFKETKKFKSKWEEYRLGDWRRGSGKTFVTLETVIPSMPDKLLTPPDEDAFHKKLKEIEEKIKSIGQDLEDKKQEFDGKLKQKIEAQKSGDGQAVVSKDRTQNFQRLNELKKERKKIYDASDVVAQKIADLQGQSGKLTKKIDRDAQTKEQIPKAVKQIKKMMETQTLDNRREKELLARIKFIQGSEEFIEEKQKLDEKIKKLNAEKKEIMVNLPKIKDEIKQLSEIVDQQKKERDEKMENRESIEKELDKINERRKRARDDRDKLYQQKYELKDDYYGSLITFQKQQFLVKDIEWMTEMQGKLRQRKEIKDRRDKEYKERQERLQKEREERARKEEERKQRELEKKQKEIENKKRMEEQLQQDEIDQLHKIIASIEDQTIASNPFADQIELCDKLSKFCLKQQAKSAGQATSKEEQAAPVKDAKADKKDVSSTELAKAAAKGSVQLAPSKQSRDTSDFSSLKTQKGKKGKKNVQSSNTDTSGQVDFAMIKQFTTLKVSPPLGEGSFETTIQTLKELSDALMYWGKIILRQKKIRHIRTSRKLKSLEEYNKLADQEEEWLKNEKQKIEDAEDEIESDGTSISLNKIKIAQTIDKEMRLKNVLKEDDEDAEEESDEDRGYTVDDIEQQPDADSQEQIPQKKERKPRQNEGGRKVKQAQKPNAQKFKEIMNANEAFPTFDNQSGDEDGGSEEQADEPAETKTN